MMACDNPMYANAKLDVVTMNIKQENMLIAGLDPSTSDSCLHLAHR
jgi:hypothetical protein